MAVPYTFANATSAIPLSQLDNNFATPVTIGNVAIQLGNTVSAIGNVTLNSATLNNSTAANVTITSVSTPITPTQGGTGNSSAFTANAVVYAPTTSTLATGSALTFDGVSLISNATTPAYFAGVSNLLQFSINRNPNTGAIFNASQSCAFMNMDGASGGSSIQFATAAAANTQPSEKMRLSSSGNLGIGQASPSYRLDVVNATGSGATTSIRLNNPGTATGDGPQILFTSGTSTTGGCAIAGYGTALNAASMVFYSGGNTERMRLNSTGNLILGNTNTPGTNTIGVQWSSDMNSYSNVISAGTATTTFNLITFYNGNGIVGTIQSSLSATLYNTTSDRRLKTNIVDAPQGNIDAIKVRSFDWIADGAHQEYGMIAQELIEVAPYAVSSKPDSDEMMGVDYSKLVPMMIKEIQTLKQRIAILENK